MVRKSRSGFTLVECTLAAAVVVVALALLGLMAGRSRKMGQLGESMANLRRMGELTGSYGADYQERFWTFTWRQDRVPADADADLAQIALSEPDTAGTGAQAIQILRRRLNRPQLEPVSGWLAQVNYSNLVLIEYAQLELPCPWLVSPGDRCRLQWIQDPLGPLEGRGLACYQQGDRYDYRYPFSWSYEVGPAFYSPDSGADTLAQGGVHYTYFVPSVPNTLGDRRMNEVRYPSQKAHVWEPHAWYFHPSGLYSHITGARFPVLGVDGAVGVRTNRALTYPEGNGGGNPRNPTSAFWYQFNYEPGPSESPIPGGRTSISVFGRQRWTRYGLLGRDFDGPEVRQP